MAVKTENTGLQGAMDAIDVALGLERAEGDETDIETEIEEGTDADATEGDADTDGESTTEGDEEGDEEGADDEGAEEDPVKAAAKGERNEDGTFKKAPEAKKPDPVNDPLPKDLKKETSERMQSLIQTVKTKDTELAQVRGEFDTIINGIRASGATPEQYGEVISWVSLFNSPEPAARLKAYELVNDVADRLATLLNIDRTISDPLTNHADLKAAVAANQLTAKYAAEIARTRNAQQFTGQIADGQRQQQQTQQQAATEESTARAALTAFEVEMRTKEGTLYELKKAQIMPTLKVLMKQIPKSQWSEAYKQAYMAAKVQPKDTIKKVAPQQPLRGNKQPAGGQVRQASSMLEAINGALSSMK